jgi:hypothetical protein
MWRKKGFGQRYERLDTWNGYVTPVSSWLRESDLGGSDR